MSLATSPRRLNYQVIEEVPAAPYQDVDDDSNGNSSNSPIRRLLRWSSERTRQCCSRESLLSLLPITSWLPSYSRTDFVGDLVAGLTVGLTVIPQGIAYGILAGLSANYGLYSAFVGCFIYCIFGSTAAITIGPTAIMALMTHEYGFHGNPDVAVFLAFFTGVIIFLAGILQLGFLIDFMPAPVISGFTSAAAITIAVSQLKGIFGIKVSGEGLIDQLRSLFDHISETNLADLSLGMASVIILVLMREMRRLLPYILPDTTASPTLSTRVRRIIYTSVRFLSIARNAIIVMAASLLVAIMSHRGSVPFSRTGSVPAGLPIPAPPHFSIFDPTTNTTMSFSHVASRLGAGLGIVPLLAVVESIAIAKAFAKGKRIDATQEMLALGLCNVVGSFFSSIPVTGSFSRTAVNSSSGVRTPLGGLFTGLLVILALQFLTPYFVLIPKATLSAVIICAVIYMVELEVIKPIWNSRKIDLLPFAATFFTCVLWGLEYGIGIGTGISLSMILFKAARPKITVREQHLTGTASVYIYVCPDSGLTYPAAEHVRAVVDEAASVHGRSVEPLVLDCNNIRYTDFTSAKCMNLLVKEFNDRHQLLVFVHMKSSILACWDGAGHCDGRITCATIAEAEDVIKEHLQLQEIKIDAVAA